MQQAKLECCDRELIEKLIAHEPSSPWIENRYSDQAVAVALRCRWLQNAKKQDPRAATAALMPPSKKIAKNITAKAATAIVASATVLGVNSIVIKATTGTASTKTPKARPAASSGSCSDGDDAVRQAPIKVNI